MLKIQKIDSTRLIRLKTLTLESDPLDWIPAVPFNMRDMEQVPKLSSASVY